MPTTRTAAAPRPLLRLARLLLLLAAAPVAATGAGAQPAPAAPDAARPFGAGEHLTYAVRVSKLGQVGHGSMWVEGPVDVRGTAAVLLRFHFRTRVGFVTASNETDSWIAADRMASLRFRKRERHPLSRHDEAVELFPAEQRWEGSEGAGRSPTDAPLDELSFIYFLRTIELRPDTTYQFDRHFDPARNPTTVRVVGHETLTTEAGEFRTTIVEMRVKDRRYRDGREGVIRINLSDDACRLPVRMESSAPVVGKAVLTLAAHRHAPGHLPRAADVSRGPSAIP
jgi:hypothetical protein